MKEDTFAISKHASFDKYDWLENFPEQYRSSILSHELGTKHRPEAEHAEPKRSARYKRLYERIETPKTQKTELVDRRQAPRIDEPNRHAHLVHANRHYATHSPTDRRQICDTRFPQEKCRRSRKHAEEKSINNFSPLREAAPTQDAIEKRKRIFSAGTTIAPMQIENLDYNVLIGDDFMFIGCIEHKIAEWRTISDREILAMDGKRSLTFWNDNKERLLKSCDLHQEKIRCINKQFS
jgi:hypothetical protein